MSDCRYTVLVSKKGKVTIKKIREEKPLEIQLAHGSRLTHNRKKEYVLPENEPVPFLVKLGVQTKEGKIIDKKYKKFRQINRFLECNGLCVGQSNSLEGKSNSFSSLLST